MARSQLYVRWMKSKAQRRKTQPKSFSNRGASTFYGHVKKTEAVYQGQARVTGSVATAKDRSEKIAERIKFYYRRLKPDHRALFDVMGREFHSAIEKDGETDPRMAVEVLMGRYIMHDPTLKAFEFDVISLGSSSDHNIWMYFRGRECFLVFRRGNVLRKSEMYLNTDFLKNLPLSKVKWAGEPVIISSAES